MPSGRISCTVGWLPAAYVLAEVWNWNRWPAVAEKVTEVFWPWVVVTVFGVPAVSAAVVSAVTAHAVMVIEPVAMAGGSTLIVQVPAVGRVVVSRKALPVQVF